MGAVQVIDDVLWTLGLESLVAKARPPSPLTPRGFTRMTRALVAALGAASDEDHDAAMAAVTQELKRRWTTLTEEQREQAFTAIYQAYVTRTLQGIERTTSVFGQHATTIVSSTRAAAGTQFGFQFNDTFNALDLEVARHLRTSQALFVRGANGKIAASLSERAREIVARGLERGFDSKDISTELAAELRGHEGKKRRDYHRMLAEVFVARSRSYGVMRSFEAAGITRYEHRAVLDEVTCNVCRFMHGRSFEVRVSLGQYQQVAESPPEDVVNIQPFMRTVRNLDGSQSIAVRSGGSIIRVADVLESGVGSIDRVGTFSSRMSDDRVQRLGCGCSPFHPYCRCTQAPVSTSTVQVPGEVRTLEPGAPVAPPTPKPAQQVEEPLGLRRLKRGVHFLRQVVPKAARPVFDRLTAELVQAIPWAESFLESNPISLLKIASKRRGNGSYGLMSQEIVLTYPRLPGSFGDTLVPTNAWSISACGPTEEQALLRTLVHEIAHHIHLFDRTKPSNQAVDQLLRTAHSRALVGNMALTRYGKSDYMEYWAETLAAYVFHREELRRFDPLAISVVETVLKLRGITL